MPEPDVYEIPNFREILREVYALGGRLALTQEELAAASGFSGSHLSNARGRTRRLTFEQGVRLGRAFWLDMDSARTFATRVCLATARPEEFEALMSQLTGLQAARQAALAEGRAPVRLPGLPPELLLHLQVLPLLFHRTALTPDPAAVAAAFRPRISVARAEHLLGLTRGWRIDPPRALPLAGADDPGARLAHVAAVRRLYYPLFHCLRPEARARLSVWAMTRDDLSYLGGQISARLRELVERVGRSEEGGEARVVMQLAGRLFLVAKAAVADTTLHASVGPAPPAALPRSDSPPGPRIMSYLDLIRYLKDRFVSRKTDRSGRTYASFARRVGLSHSAVRNIVQGIRALTEEHVDAFGVALGLKGDELAYFRLLAELKRTDCPVRLTEIREKMSQLRLKHGFVSPDLDQLLFYARWSYSVIREMAFWPDFQAEPAWIAPRLSPAIAEAEAEDALSALTKLGILVPDAAGVPRPGGPVVALPDTVRGDTETCLYQYVADLAEHALLTAPPDELFADGWCLSVPVSRVGEVIDGLAEIQYAVETWLSQRTAETPPDRVGMLFLDAVPLSLELTPGKG